MEFNIPLPASALEVENLIRSNCQHWGYPGAEIDISPNGRELILHLKDPDPLIRTDRSSRPIC